MANPKQAFTQIAPNPPVAIAFMLAASVLFAIVTLLAKSLGTDVLGPPLNPIQITHGRFLFALIVLSTAAALVRPQFERPNMGIHLARTTLGASGVCLIFAAVAFIPLSDATAISFLNPVFGMLLAIPLLGEKVGKWRWIAAGIALIGAVILLRPGPGTLQFGALLALAAAMMIGFEIILIKKLSGRERPFQILLINNVLGLALTSIAVLFVWQTPTAHQWFALAGIGLCMAGAQASYVNAMRRAEASFVLPFTYSTLVFAALFDLALFGVVPDAISVTGALTILAGAALQAWREMGAKRG